MRTTQLTPERTAQTAPGRFLLAIEVAGFTVEKAGQLGDISAASLAAKAELAKLTTADWAVYAEMSRRHQRGESDDEINEAIEAVDPLIEQRGMYEDVASLVTREGSRVVHGLEEILLTEKIVNIGNRSYMLDPLVQENRRVITSDNLDNTLVYLSGERTADDGRLATPEDYATLIVDLAALQQSFLAQPANSP